MPQNKTKKNRSSLSWTNARGRLDARPPPIPAWRIRSLLDKAEAAERAATRGAALSAGAAHAASERRRRGLGRARDRARGRNEQRFVVGIDDAGEGGITTPTVQAVAFKAARVDARRAISPEHQRCGASRAIDNAKLPALAHRGRRLAHGKLPHCNFPRRLEPDRRGRIARRTCRFGGDAPRFCQGVFRGPAVCRRQGAARRTRPSRPKLATS